MLESHRWNPHVRERINEWLRQPRPAGAYAALDFDQTLVAADTMEPLIAYLFATGKIDPEWPALPSPGQPHDGEHVFAFYQRMLAEGKKRETFAWFARLLAGLTVGDIVETTRQMLARAEPVRATDRHGHQVIVQLPRPYPEMQELVVALARVGLHIHVVTASSVFPVRVLAERWFGVRPADVVGVSAVLHGPAGERADDRELIARYGEMDAYSRYRLDAELADPVTSFDGKLDGLRGVRAEPRFNGGGFRPPSFAAGDSDNDLPMLDSVDPVQGLRLWLRRSDGDELAARLGDPSDEAGRASGWLIQRADPRTGRFLPAR